MAIKVGQPAPAFELYNTEKKRVTLEDFKGRSVVLLFFPFAFSSTCTKELCEMQENYSFYDKLNAQIIGISVDSLYTNAKFKAEYKLNFLLLSDFNKEVSAAYDSLDATFSFGYRGVSKRASFVIDKNGILVYAEILPSPGDYPNMQKLKEVVGSLS